MSLRARFEASKKRRVKEIDIPGFGKVWIQSLNERQRASIEAGVVEMIQGKRGRKLEEAQHDLAIRARARLIAAVVVDEHETRVFNDKESTLDEILEMDSAVLDAIAREIDEHCGNPNLTDEDYEEMEKNLGAVLAECGPTSSPEIAATPT